MNDRLRPPPGVSALLTAAVNRLLSLDPDALARLSRLEGRRIRVEIREWKQVLHAEILGGQLEVLLEETEQVDVTLRGGAADFLALAAANRRGEAIEAGRIEISGDLAVAQEVQSLLAELEPDLEQWLSSKLGDVAAHRIGRAARGAIGFGGRSARQFQAELADFLLHEIRILPLQHELAAFGRDVFALDDDVERCAARLDALRRRRALT